MFYAGMSAPTSTGHESIGRATATVANPTDWAEYSGNPIIGSASSGNIRLDSVQYVSGTWYLYSTDVTNNNIDLYTSTDGFIFTPYSGNPVLTPTGQGCSDGTVVSQGSVLYDSGTWRMYYDYRNGSNVLPGIRYATSLDGKIWTKQGCVDLITRIPGGLNSTYIEWQQILKLDDYYMLVYGGYNGSYWSTGLAYSSSPGSGFIQSFANPVFSPTFASVPVGLSPENNIATTAFYQIGLNWYAFYQWTNTALGGNYSTSNWSMGIASFPAGEDPTSAIP